MAASARGAPHELCHQAAQKAAHATGVPLDVLTAISLTESGRKTNGRIEPWPWALNAAGAGYWLPSRSSALEMAQSLRDEGRRNFDVGCFQINYRWHGDAFASLEEMLEPDRNATYAAEFLARLRAETGDWSRAAGRYHSATPELAARYRQRFDTHLAAQANAAPTTVRARNDRQNNFPLLTGTTTYKSPGSLMPETSAIGSLLRGAPAPFWSGT